ncbi:MAG: hypothetical protein AAGK74_02350 [Chloroflexota bacterium]
MVLETRPMTVAQFDAFVLRPENHDRMFEFIGGEIVEVPCNPHVSCVGALSGFELKVADIFGQEEA